MRKNMRKIISVVLLIAMFITSTLTVFPAMTAGAATPVFEATNKGLGFSSGYGEVYTATSKLQTLPYTYEMTVDPINFDDGKGYQIIYSASGTKLAEEGSSAGRYNVNVPMSVLTIDQIKADTCKVGGVDYGTSLRFYLFKTVPVNKSPRANDTYINYDEGSVIFLGALANPSDSSKALTGPVHLALSIDAAAGSIDLYVNGTKFTGQKKYEYIASEGLPASDAGIISLYNSLEVDSMPCHTLGGDFRIQGGTENKRYYCGKIYNFAAFADARGLEDTTYKNSDNQTVTKTGIISHIPSLNANGTYNTGMPSADGDLLFWYNTKDITTNGEIPDASGNGYKLTKGVGHASVSVAHVPADFDNDGYTDKWDWNGDGVLGDDEYARPIGTLDELLAIESHDKTLASASYVAAHTGSDGVYGRGGKYYLTKDIKIPATTKTGTSVLYHDADHRLTDDLYIDGCGYTIEYDKSNTTKNTAIALIGHGTYSRDTYIAKVYIWNLNVSGNMRDGDDNEGSSGSNIATLMRTGTNGLNYFKNVCVSANVTVGKHTYTKTIGGVEKTFTGANRAVAGIIAKNVGADVLFEDVTYSGNVVSYDDMHDLGGKGTQAPYEIPADTDYNTGKSFSSTGLGGFMGNVDIGGIITFRNCVNMGVVEAKGELGDDGNDGYQDVGAFVGGFLGRATNATTAPINFENCLNMGDVIAINSENMSVHMGGLIGGTQARKVNISDSKNLGVLRLILKYQGEGRASLGGLVGRARLSNVEITGSRNEGAIMSQGQVMTGGILAHALFRNVDIDRCFNSGSIIAYADSVTDDTGNGHGDCGIGGILGATTGDNWAGYEIHITNSGNSGNITLSMEVSGQKNAKDAHLAGIWGKASSTPRLEVVNCNNTGDINYEGNKSSWGAAAGILGNIKDNFPSNAIENGSQRELRHKWHIISCVNTGNITGPYHAGGILDGIKCINTGEGSSVPGELYLKVQGCKNFGDVTETYSSDGVEYGTAGIVADLYPAESANYTHRPYKFWFDILDCYNVGNITSSGEYVGGIVGEYRAHKKHWTSGTVTSTIQRCVNAGKVLSKPYVGKITETKNANGTFSYSRTNNNFPTRCGDSWGAFAGGIIAYAELMPTSTTNATPTTLLNISDCINIGEVTMDGWYYENADANGVKDTIEYTGYGTFPIINCTENRAQNRHKLTVNLKDAEGNDSGNTYFSQYYMGYINNGPESDTAKNGNVFLATSMTGREAWEKAGKSHQSWNCKETTNKDGTTADEDCWHEFSDEKDSNGIEAKLNTNTYSKNEYYTVSDIGLLKLYAKSSSGADAFTRLMALLSTSYTYNETDYTTETWAVFFRARANAAAPNRYNDKMEVISTVADKLEAAINNLAAPDYSALQDAIISTYISPEKIHNYDVTTRKAYEIAYDEANKALTSRTQATINSATTKLLTAYGGLAKTSPSYIIVIPESFVVDEKTTTSAKQELKVLTSEFHDNTYLDVKIGYNGKLTNTATAVDQIDYTIKIDNGDAVGDKSTKILTFEGADNTTKKENLYVDIVYYTGDNGANNSKYVAGTYTGSATFYVNLDTNWDPMEN